MAAGIGWLTLNWYRTQSGEEPFGAPFTLVDQKGAAISEAAFRGHPTALFFGFTHCPEVCPTTLVELDGWLKKLGDEGKDIRAYFVYDRSRARHARNHGPLCQQHFGPHYRHHRRPGKGRRDGQGLQDLRKKVPSDDGDYTMDHTASVLLLDGNGAFSGTIAYGENPIPRSTS